MGSKRSTKKIEQQKLNAKQREFRARKKRGFTVISNRAFSIFESSNPHSVKSKNHTTQTIPRKNSSANFTRAKNALARVLGFFALSHAAPASIFEFPVATWTSGAKETRPGLPPPRKQPLFRPALIRNAPPTTRLRCMRVIRTYGKFFFLEWRHWCMAANRWVSMTRETTVIAFWFFFLAGVHLFFICVWLCCSLLWTIFVCFSFDGFYAENWYVLALESFYWVYLKFVIFLIWNINQRCFFWKICFHLNILRRNVNRTHYFIRLVFGK